MNLTDRMKAGDRLLATFFKTPHHVLIEVLAATGLDCVILDGEHAPFGPSELDGCIGAARGVCLPVLVRLLEGRQGEILQVLDMGADGIVVPHVTSAEQARAVVRAAQYGPGGRGFAGTTRAGAYGGRAMQEHLAGSRAPTIVVQIEDPEGVEAAEEIAEVPGISCCFLGRVDLTVAYGCDSTEAPEVEEAVQRVMSVCRQNGMPLSTFAPDLESATKWFERGMAIVAVGSEHSAMQRYFSPKAAARARGAS